MEKEKALITQGFLHLVERIPTYFGGGAGT